MSLPLRILLAGAVVAAITGCWSRSARQADNFEPITIEIDNQNFSDLTAYLIWNADRRRLGSVSGKRAATFRSNWYGPVVQVEVEILAGRRHAGPSFSVSPGDDILVEVPPNIDQQLRVIKRRR